MKIKNKKLISSLLFIIIVLSFVLGGCTNSDSNIQSSSENISETEDSLTESTEEAPIRSGYAFVENDENIIDDNYRTYYEVFLYSFCDSDGDGIGDINGLISKLDYINDNNPDTDTDLGCNGIWLMPIMPSTTYHKYDVTDYYNIDSQYGTLDDFKKLVEECDKRGIKIIIDFVLNHTSAKHEWFLKASEYLKSLPEGKEPDLNECPYVDYYNFVQGNQNLAKYSKLDGCDWYYECQFWDQMPDLNLGNEQVRKEFENITDFWMDLGVDGFRVDAAKEFYSGCIDLNIEVLSWFNSYVKSKDENAYIVAEVWDSYSIYSKYYESGIDSVFDYAFGSYEGRISKTLSTNSSDYSGQALAKSMVKCYNGIMEINPEAIPAPFLSNHDVNRASVALGNDEDKIKMAGGITMMMNGSAFIYYGEEIGMSGKGKDENKRAPMLWSTENEEGMTVGPIDMEEVTSSFASVEDQLADKGSILNYYIKAIRLRNENPEIARGSMNIIEEVEDEDICAITKTYEDSTIIILMNCSDEEKTVIVPNQIASSQASQNAKYVYTHINGMLSVGGEEVTLAGDNVTMPPYSIVILK